MGDILIKKVFGKHMESHGETISVDFQEIKPNGRLNSLEMMKEEPNMTLRRGQYSYEKDGCIETYDLRVVANVKLTRRGKSKKVRIGLTLDSKQLAEIASKTQEWINPDGTVKKLG